MLCYLPSVQAICLGMLYKNSIGCVLSSRITVGLCFCVSVFDIFCPVSNQPLVFLFLYFELLFLYSLSDYGTCQFPPQHYHILFDYDNGSPVPASRLELYFVIWAYSKLQLPSNILLTGEAGSGKKTTVQACCRWLGVNLFEVGHSVVHIYAYLVLLGNHFVEKLSSSLAFNYNRQYIWYRHTSVLNNLCVYCLGRLHEVDWGDICCSGSTSVDSV